MIEERTPQGPVPAGGQIRVLGGFFDGLEVELNQEWFIVGRGREANLILAEPTISRAHAAVGFDGHHFFLRDLGSTNGSFVNGRPRIEAVLADRDEVQMGRLRLRVSLPL